MMPTPHQLYAELQQKRPHAARLALLTCLPVRVSPQFLRMARVNLLGDGNTGDEADLWLSELVETRAVAGISYRPDVREYLRQQLAADRALLDTLWQNVHQPYARWLTPRACMEEELSWRLLRDRNDPAINDIWRSVVTEMADGANTEGLARWVIRAQSDLPPGSHDHEGGRLAHYGAHLVLGDASILGDEAQHFLESGELHFATRHLAKRRIYVGLDADRGLLIQPERPFKHGHAIDLPATRPLWLQLESDQVWAAPVVIRMDGTEAVHRPWGMDALTLRLINGAAYELRLPMNSVHRAFKMNIQRVRIEYSPASNPEQNIELPFIVGVLADLAGKSTLPRVVPEKRQFTPVDTDNFDQFMGSIQPRVSFGLRTEPGTKHYMTISLTFHRMEDFSPYAIIQSIKPLRLRWQIRLHIARVFAYIKLKPPLVRLLDEILMNDELLHALLDETQAVERSIAEHLGAAFESHFRDALSELDKKGQAGFRRALRTIAEMIVMEKIGDRNRSSPELVLSAIIVCDQQISLILNAILHHPAFQRLEGAWRGLHHLVSHTEHDERLRVQVMQLSKEELRTACTASDDRGWEASLLYQKIHEEVFHPFGGRDGLPYGCLVGDYYFDKKPEDLALLKNMAHIASAAHTPFIAGASASLLDAQSWAEADEGKAMSMLFDPDFTAWNEFRTDETARYLYLTAPRFLARATYKDQGYSDTQPPDARARGIRWKTLPADFSFTEDIRETSNPPLVWANSTYALAAVITRAFAVHGWCGDIKGDEGGGFVGSLPSCLNTDAFGSDIVIGPLEADIANRFNFFVERIGILPFAKVPGFRAAAFEKIPSLYAPQEDNPDELLTARLDCILAASRFMHYIKIIARDNIKSFRSTNDAIEYLNRWIFQYLSPDDSASEEQRRQFPLRYALIQQLEQSAEGYSNLQIDLTPRYQVPDLNNSFIRMHTQIIGLRYP